MRRVLVGVHILHLQFDVAVDEVVAEDVAALQERAVLVQIVQRFAQAAADLRDVLQLFRRKGVQNRNPS